MPLPPSVNEDTIRSHATEQSFHRGDRYYRQGAVIALIQRGNTLIGKVEGSEYEPYRVSIQFDQGGLTGATCSCLYSFEGWCKHIVATLLAGLDSPEAIQQRPSLDELFGVLTRDRLQTLLEDLLAEQPELIEDIEILLKIDELEDEIQPTVSNRTPRRTLVDPQPFYSQVQRMLNYGVGSWDDSPALDEIRGVIAKADDFTQEGDGANAVVILEAIIDAYRESWMNLDGSSGESGELFYELDEAFAEALLSTHISTEDQTEWQESLEIWEEDAEAYGIDQAFAKSQTALIQGWDDPELVAILQGETTDGSDLEEPETRFGYSTLAQIRLDILKRQARYEDYLNLAKAQGCGQEYLTMLVQIERTEQAIAEAPQTLNDPRSALAVAIALRAKGALTQALEIAKLGLACEGYGKGQLAEWTSELAEGFGQTETSLQSRVTAFTEAPSSADYLKIQQLAGPTGWPKLQKKLLANLRKDHTFSIQAAVDIFLHEGLIQDAINIIDQSSSYNSAPIRQVMEAAIKQQPDWVIANACRRAEAIMDAGKAKYYHHAVDWLRYIQRAYQQSGQQQKWQTYYDKLRQKHSRKRKLISLLQVFE